MQFTLWTLLLILWQSALQMGALAVGAVFHSTQGGIPPAFVKWNDGREFTVELHITRIT